MLMSEHLQDVTSGFSMYESSDCYADTCIYLRSEENFNEYKEARNMVTAKMRSAQNDYERTF